MINKQPNIQEQKEIFSAKIVLFDIQNGSGHIVMINSEQAAEYWIKDDDKISLIRRWEEFVVDVSLTDSYVQANEIWVTKDFMDEYPVMEWDTVIVSFVQNNPLSMQAIRKKLLWKKITDEEIDAIIEDVKNNKIHDLVLAYYVATSFFYKSDIHELAYTTKATAYTWDMYRFPWIVAGKYCIWWVPGNETTMIVVPILASLWITMPKTFSKAITSPAATGECVNVLMDINFNKEGIEELVKKVNCCLVWGGWLDLAPADDKLIKVQYPLSMQSKAKVVSSIMAKKYAMGVTHSLIDIPVWPTAKVTSLREARDWQRRFERVGKKLWMKMSVQITKANEVIGNGVWAVLQVREVLRILQQHPLRAKDLEKKIIFLGGRLIENIWLAKTKRSAEALARKQLESGAAWKKMQEIIEAQWWNPDVDSEKLNLGTHTYDVIAKKSGKLKFMDLHDVNAICRKLGCPVIDEAGMYLHKKLGDSIKKWEIIATLYANDETSLKAGIERLNERSPFTI